MNAELAAFYIRLLGPGLFQTFVTMFGRGPVLLVNCRAEWGFRVTIAADVMWEPRLPAL